MRFLRTISPFLEDYMTYRDVEQYYEELRRNAVAKRDYYRALAERLPDFIALEQEEKAALMALYRAEYEGLSSADGLRQTAKQKTAAKNAALAAAGINPDDLTLHYACEKCKDTGFVDTKPCTCYSDARKKILLERGVTADFPSFASHTAKKEAALDKFHHSIQNFSGIFPETQVKTLVFSGNCGTGKTFLMQAFCKEIEAKGFSVCYHTALELNQLFLDYHTTKNGLRADIMDRLLLSDLLAIDDLGTEPILKNVTVEYLLSVISTRALRKKHTVITTNLGGGEVLSRYGERLFSRLVDKASARWLLFRDIPDLRLTPPAK